MTEIRITNDRTGGAKGTKPERYGLVPVEPLAALAKHYGIGALKYEDDNWMRGYDWALSYDALQRHANLWWSGEEWGVERFINRHTGEEVLVMVNHMIAVAWHAFALYYFSIHHRDGDLMPARFAQVTDSDSAYQVFVSKPAPLVTT